MWFKKEIEEKGDNDFDAGDWQTSSSSHDMKIEFEDSKEDLSSRSKLSCMAISMDFHDYHGF